MEKHVVIPIFEYLCKDILILHLLLMSIQIQVDALPPNYRFLRTNTIFSWDAVGNLRKHYCYK